MTRTNGIFIAATGQNVGKTTLCLGMLSGLRKRHPTVGFIKPVGQQHVKVNESTMVDKDVILFKKHFHLDADWQDMSPVIIPAGFTRDFLDKKTTETEMTARIHEAFEKIASMNAYTVVEGTGHVGVGSIIGLNNARVAAELSLDMVIIASGGLGSAYDELSLNIEMCKHYGVKVRGVILNRVLEEKRGMIEEYFPKALEKWGIPLIGCVPYNAFLSTPSIKDFETLFATSLLAGEQHRYRHFQHSRLVAGSLDTYKNDMTPNELIITPASREDIIVATLQKHLEASEIDGIDFCGGMLLTSVYPPSQNIIEQIKKVDIPVLYAPICSYDAMKMITSYTAKIGTGDVVKVEKAIALVESHINFDLL